MQLTNLLIRLVNYQNLQNEQRFYRTNIQIFGAIGLLLLPWVMILPKIFSIYFGTIVFICLFAQIWLFFKVFKLISETKRLKEIIKWEMKN